MKLPEDPKERIKILALIGIGAVAVIYMAIALVIKPLFGAEARYRKEIAEVNESLMASQRDMNHMLREREGNVRSLEAITDISDRRRLILHPRLGNYELGAREFLESIAVQAGVTMEAIREIGVTQMPQSPDLKNEKSLKFYTLRVDLEAGLHDLMRMLVALENANPYIGLSSLTINTRPEDPGKHQIDVELQWPVWADAKMNDTIKLRLEEAMAFNDSVRPGDAATAEAAH
jgi:hypothetical protein